MSGHQVVPNAVVWDGRLSYRALGVLTALLARQAVGASTAATALAEGADREGRDAIRTAYSELEAAGYWHTALVSNGDRGVRKLTRAYPTPMTADDARTDMLARTRPHRVTAADFQAVENAENQAVSTADFQAVERTGTADSQASENQAVVPTEPNHGKIQRGPRIPTCPACGELHYPRAACSAAFPLLTTAPNPHHGRRHWAFVAAAQRDASG